MKYERGFIKYTTNGICERIDNTLYLQNSEKKFLNAVFSGKNKLRQIIYEIEAEDIETNEKYSENIFTLFAN